VRHCFKYLLHGLNKKNQMIITFVFAMQAVTAKCSTSSVRHYVRIQLLRKVETCNAGIEQNAYSLSYRDINRNEHL